MTAELDKTILITGAARGVGRATSLLAASRGARVVLVDREPEGIDSAAALIRSGGGQAIAIVADVTDEPQVEAAIAEAEQQFGPIDGVVNNAAVMVAGSLIELSLADFSRVMDVNVVGTFLFAKHAIRSFLRNETKGSIVNLHSISGEVGLEGQPAYCASKGAVKTLTKQIAVDYAHLGIRCNAVGPGSIEGEFLDSYLGALEQPDVARSEILANHPIGRLSQPAEIAEPICFLLSDRASFITGATLMADGGYTAR